MKYDALKKPVRGLLLWIDDESHTVYPYVKKLCKEGFAVELSSTPNEALDWLEARINSNKALPDVIILDIWMPPGVSETSRPELNNASHQSMGAALLKYLQTKKMNIPVIVVSGVLNNELVQSLSSFKCVGDSGRIIPKPPRTSNLVRIVESLVGESISGRRTAKNQ